MAKIAELIDGRTWKLEAHAWPGGYPILYLDRDNCVLCPACASRTLWDLDDSDGGRYWGPKAWYIHWEGPPDTCEECNAGVESAYGDPDSED
jgi:hypothetical protein